MYRYRSQRLSNHQLTKGSFALRGRVFMVWLPGLCFLPWQAMPCRKLGLLFLSVYVVSVFGMFIIFASLDHQDVLDFQAMRTRLHWGQSEVSAPHQVQCPPAPNGSVNYIKLDGRIQVMSAYFDTRLEQLNYVRAILVVLGRFGLPKVYCTVLVTNISDTSYTVRNLTIKANLYEFNENHDRRYGGQLLSCPLPKTMVLMDCSLLLQTVSKRFPNRTAALNMSVIPGIKMSHKYKFSVCVPPLWGYAKPPQIVEFIEILKILGVQHVYFYVMQNKPGKTMFPNKKEVSVYLDYYKKEGIVSVTEWSLPTQSPTEIWYNGQVLAIHHCLYSSMGVSKFVAFMDIDEILVSKVSQNWSGLIDYIESNNNGSHCGYRINMSFFPPVPLVGPVLMNSVYRSRKTTDIRTKCIVRPERIFEMGIHHISKQLREDWRPMSVPDTVALIHHYRSCDAMFGMKCGTMIEDKTLLQHQQEFIPKYSKVLEAIKKLKLKESQID